MIGLEKLKKEMKKRGCSQQQIEAKATMVVLDILSETGTTFTDACMIEKEAKEIMGAAREREAYLSRREEALARREAKFRREQEDAKRYIDDFYKALEECETKEGRDAMRRAQAFINTVEIETPQNNTAFIDGLARILSLGEMSSFLKFEKVAEIPGKSSQS